MAVRWGREGHVSRTGEAVEDPHIVWRDAALLSAARRCDETLFAVVCGVTPPAGCSSAKLKSTQLA